MSFVTVFCATLLFYVLHVSSTIDNTDDYTYYWPPFPFPLTWGEAETYCNKQCNSNLATVPTATQAALIVDILPDLKEAVVWIGLHKSDITGSYEWMGDNTSFHYESPTWSNDCIYLNLTDNLLYDASCNTLSIFICNSCHDIINKYILTPKEDVTHYDAFPLCNELYETSLASIHSQSDYQEAINLCQIYGNNSCWIGLMYIVNEHIWEWQDGTTLDFGSNMDKYPWNDTPTNEEHIDCVRIYHNGSEWLWSAAECDHDSITSYPLCNMPSELCNEPYIVHGNEESIHFSCEDHYIGDEDYTMVILNTEPLTNSESSTVFEFMFSISSVDDDISGDGGLILTDIDIECSYLYIGVSVSDSVSDRVLFMNLETGGHIVVNKEVIIPSNISDSEYYVLRIAASLDDRHVEVYLNNLKLLIHDFGTVDLTPGYIGMITNNAEIIGTYLYVSGTNVNIKDMDGLDDFYGCVDTDADDSNDSMEILQNESIIGITIGIVCFCVICGVVIFYLFIKQSKKTKEKTEQETKEIVEQEKKKEIEEKERKYTNLQQKSDERIQELEEQVKQLKQLEEQRKSMDAMVQPGSLPIDINAKNVCAAAEEPDGAEGVPGNAHDGDVHVHREGFEKATQLESAVRLDIPQAAYMSKKDIYETNDGRNTGDDGKGVMDEMLADVLEMQNSNSNKVDGMDNDDTDSNSDNMYDKPEDDDEKKENNKTGDESISIHTHSSHREEDIRSELNVNEKEKNVENDGLSNEIGIAVSQMNVHNGSDDSHSENSDGMYDIAELELAFKTMF